MNTQSYLTDWSFLPCWDVLFFSIPVGLGFIDYTDRPFFGKGLLIGLIIIPIGGIAGGLITGFDEWME